MKWMNRILEDVNPSQERNKIGIIAGIIGIISNLFLFGIKILAGWLGNSVSIIADAMNSLSDSASSLLTIIGFRMAAKPADKDHPYGHQRAEYISGLFVSIIIIVVGVQFFLQSIEKIRQPEPVSPSWLVVIILLVSLVIKIGQGKTYFSLAKSTQSDTIAAVGQDSFNDVLMTGTVLASYIVEFFTGWFLDGYIGLLVASFIIYSGIEAIRSAIDDLLGSRPRPELTQAIVSILEKQPKIIGFHDLNIHGYGPNQVYASLHVEVDARLTLMEAHDILDLIEKEVQDQLGITMVAHVDPIVLDDDLQNHLHKQVKEVIKSANNYFNFHDFRVYNGDDGQQVISFDLVVPEGVDRSNQDLYDQLSREIHKFAPGAQIKIDFDRYYLLNDAKK